MLAAISDARGVPPDNLVAGGGSSDLIFLALRHWLGAGSRVLLLDPTYGEYSHVLENVIGCQVRRLTVRRQDNYEITAAAWEKALRQQFDIVVLVNPNSPTGAMVNRARLESWLAQIGPETRVWVDETYIDYAGASESVERFAANSENVVVCKSMSKVYALSGLRVGYLCGPARLIAGLRRISPPWAVGLAGQLAAIEALKDPQYYAERYLETHALRHELAAGLRARIGADVVEGAANFVLAHLPPAGPDAAAVVLVCASAGIYLRDAGGMGTGMGSHVLRIAVKSAEQNARVVQAIATALEHPYRRMQTFQPLPVLSPS
jgi:histidinol-phosphate/aromatic aminotransferase/cobyric acid decarboxylase-like protein